MVVKRALRGQTNGGAGAEGKVCSVAWQRQCLHHQQLRSKMGVQGGEVLPIVEPKPFIQKVWRREKSLPNFRVRPVSLGNLETEKADSVKKGPSLGTKQCYLHQLNQQSQTQDIRHGLDHSQRQRTNLHPKADFSFEGRSEHQHDLIPSFVSRQERSKTAVWESVTHAVSVTSTTDSENTGSDKGFGGSITQRSLGQNAGQVVDGEVSTSCARDKTLQRQTLCVTGEKLSTTNLGRRLLPYLQIPSQCSHKQTSAADFCPRHALNLSLWPRGGETLMSSARGQLFPRHLVLLGSCFVPSDKTPQQSPKVKGQNPHKFSSTVAAAQDSVLRTGASTVLEQHLSFDKELRLERYRREKGFTIGNEPTLLTSSHFVAYDRLPTLGEVTLRKAREANRAHGGNKTSCIRNDNENLVCVVPCVRNNNGDITLEHVLDDSSRSSNSDRADSGIMSSPREHACDLSLEISYPRDVANDSPEHPGNCEEAVERESLQSAAHWMVSAENS